MQEITQLHYGLYMMQTQNQSIGRSNQVKPGASGASPLLSSKRSARPRVWTLFAHEY